MQTPHDPDGTDPTDPRGREPASGVEQAGTEAPPSPSPDGVEEQTQVEAFDEEGAGIAAKE